MSLTRNCRITFVIVSRGPGKEMNPTAAAIPEDIACLEQTVGSIKTPSLRFEVAHSWLRLEALHIPCQWSEPALAAGVCQSV